MWAEQLRIEFDLDETARASSRASLTAGSSAVLQRWTRDRVDVDRATELFVAMARAQAEAAARVSPE